MKRIKAFSLIGTIAIFALTFSSFTPAGKSSGTGINIGNVAPEISLKNPEGKEIKLSSLRGSYVLIDFWASWCGPCRRENPTLVSAYNKYKDASFKGASPKKGLKIYSVSLDRDHNAWVNAIKQDNLIWPQHVSDLQFWNSAAAKLYQINSIPSNLLIDPKGVIVAKNLKGGNLLLELDKLLAS